MAYANCQIDFQQPFQEKPEVIKVTDPKVIEAIKKSFKYSIIFNSIKISIIFGSS